ncbi:peptidoglycan DD-metalloendopeptidase family protein [Pacificimonas sp. WHA3]|uniref:Peptidoglycan DD-metalloendopeptidase family protein n=1 Tax=Pacificimonas pallii TaxID=2827236 RepID=A0ABS6SH27_9SPHN|nr:peptidoglycan DD-metalloendopeptidase family protein [Pacificimonas pallii]MBV7257719.1 peptidoglycan DD-metalloendopeptidase family protein [Pacificimonas pallii]
MFANTQAPAPAHPAQRFFVDLGDDIGTGRWWRGMASLVIMLAIAFLIASSPASLPARAAPALQSAQLGSLTAIRVAPLSKGGQTGMKVSATALVKPLKETPERPRIELVAELGAVDSFSGALRRAGVSMSDIAEATSLVQDHADISRLQPGTTFDLVLGRRTDRTQPRPLEELAFRAAFDLKIEIARNASRDLFVRPVPIRIDDTPLRVSGLVGDSLYKSARTAGLPSRVVANFIKVLSPRVNFQRNVYASDEFDVVVAHKRAETGETQTGELLYARLDGQGKDLEIAAWEKDGKTQYFLADGKGVKEGMSLSPVRGARTSSGFGMRRHPVLKRTRMHKGIDYAARSGTPIEATAAGTVIFAGRNGGYGNQVRIRHRNGIVTSYSHMRGFADGIGRGTSVSQGQKIGYVGSTGMSTGPHLHYEVHVAGRAVNPRSQKLPTGVELTGSELRAFQTELARLRGISPVGNKDEAGADIEVVNGP